MSTTVTILLAISVMLLLGVVMAWILGWANVAFHVEVDPKIDFILEILPGANCGACGYAGCGEYATQLVEGNAKVGECPQCNKEMVEKIAAILGVAATDVMPFKAVVHCTAKEMHKMNLREYAGEKTCAAANMLSGIQGCTYGCLGLGDCVRACPYGAIKIVDGLATVSYDKCMGCKICASVCPRNIITIIPFKRSRMLVVKCSNHDAGPEVKSVCKVGCLGCGICTRNDSVFKIDNNLAVINYENFTENPAHAVAVSKCPAAALEYVGEPSLDEMEAVKDEKLEDVVTADFKTTVNETKWRG
ncbi:MAG: RnfABCDGE type electron transport complex subunit B [Planctomycetia bacterium]|nr:RnfABCDGE type electron transport complex subunit B [Planctomycetia bacterium]